MTPRQERSMTVDERLARAIGAKGWTQEEASLELGVSRLTINKLINGRSSITPEMAVRLETVFEVPAMTWLRFQAERELQEVRDDLAEWVQRYRRQKGKGRR